MTASTLSPEQRSYLINRLDQIQQDKIQAKRVELYGPAGRPESPTWGTVFAAIRAGEIVLKPGTEHNTNAYLNPNDVDWPAQQAKSVELEEYKDRLDAERQRLMDNIMLGEEGTDIIAEFAVL